MNALVLNLIQTHAAVRQERRETLRTPSRLAAASQQPPVVAERVEQPRTPTTCVLGAAESVNDTQRSKFHRPRARPRRPARANRQPISYAVQWLLCSMRYSRYTYHYSMPYAAPTSTSR